eukprot:2213417-Heterocapsa_arctica.AAC.1
MEEYIDRGDISPVHFHDMSMGAQDVPVPGDDDADQVTHIATIDAGASETASPRGRSDLLEATEETIVTASETIPFKR